MINIHIEGLDSLNRRLAKIGNVGKELHTTTDKAVKYVHSQVPAYPPTRPGQRYVRTGTLGRSIGTEVRSLGASMVGTIGTSTVYAPWVISDRSVGGVGPQAWMHVGRWWTLQGVVRKARDGVIRIYEDMLKRLVHG